MADHLRMFAALCGSSGPGGGLGLFLGLFVAGLVGSVVHCVPMCGPFVLGQVSSRLARIPAARLCERQRVGNGVLLPYHLGRLATYSVLGMIAGGSGAALGLLPFMGWLPGALLLLGAALFLAQAVQRLAPTWRPLAGLLPRVGTPWVSSVATLARRINRSRPGGGFLLGVVLGCLPCGFLYAALAVATATGQPGRGALAMATFGLGTVPSLVILGIVGISGGRVWSCVMVAIGPAILLVNATLLAALALQRLIEAG